MCGAYGCELRRDTRPFVPERRAGAMSHFMTFLRSKIEEHMESSSEREKAWEERVRSSKRGAEQA